MSLELVSSEVFMSFKLEKVVVDHEAVLWLAWFFVLIFNLMKGGECFAAR